MYVQNNDVTYSNSFGVEHIPKEIRTFIGNKNIKTNIFRIQAYDSIMCGYFCNGFIDLMVARKALTGFTNLFSPNNLKRWSCNFKLFYDKYLKMSECNSVEHSSTECNFNDHGFHETHNMHPNLNAVPLNAIPLNEVLLSNQQHFRLNKINEIKDYFVAEIRERELMSKILSKYIASFDYFGKSLIFLSVTTGSISIASLVHLQEWQVQVLALHFRFLQEL